MLETFLAGVATAIASIAGTIFFFIRYSNSEMATNRRLHKVELELMEKNNEIREKTINEEHTLYVTELARDTYFKHQEQLNAIQKEANIRAGKSLKRSKEVKLGQSMENLAPFLDGMDEHPNDLQFMGAPIDFISYKGKNKDDISEIHFIEVKTGMSKLNARQKQIKAAIEAGKVFWKVFRIKTKKQIVPHDKKLAKDNMCLCDTCVEK